MASSCLLRGILISTLVLIATINADGSCNKGCPRSDNGILKYTPGNFYEYGFESILTVGLSSGVVSEADDTSLKVTGSAKVFASGNCGYTLQIGSVKVINTKESVEKKLVTNIQKPVHFTWVSGQLEPEICTDASDSAYSLNIKRAVISLLQSGSGSDVESEVDVFGQCPTHVSRSTSGNGETITKVRNLNNCAYREHINSGLITGVVNEKAGVRSSSLLQSDYSKESRIERGIVEHVKLEELYKFAGSAKGNTDISAKVLTTLKLKNGASGTPGAAPASGTHRVSIIFQTSEIYPTKNIAAVKTAFSELVDLTSDYVKKDTAKKFIELIRLLRNSDTDTLLELGAMPHPNKALARKVYLDALFRTNTAESARAILKQLNKLAEKEKLIAILSLNLVESVDRDLLNQAAQLLPQAPKEIYLVVGNLISKFCSRNGCQSSDIEPISKKFVDGLKHCKPNTKQDEERIVYVLKGIGNTHNLVNNLIPALTECVSPGRSTRIRVAALHAFSSSSCNEVLSSKALDLLKDHNEDSELRIEAYLAAINCPTAELANQISELVNSEEVYQVGGFIESSLKTIRDSTDAARELQRYHLKNIRVTKQFPKDYRRYSFNNGFSYRLDALGFSASSDYKLIYSQHGFLPRSARLNFTTEIFGTNFNIFEASVRQENVESLLEYYVGPKGLLNKDFDEIVKLIEVGNAQTGGSRARRSIADDATKTAKKYKTYGTKNIQDLNLDLSLKLFGSELSFLSLGDNIPSTLDDIIKHFSDAFDKAKKELSSFEKQYTCHHLFLDAELSYPTGLGVPLEFGAQGFASNKIDFAVNVDVNDILEQNWQRSQYRLKLVPSIDVNVNVQLGFNTQVLSTGLRVVSTAHSATGSDVTVSLINNGEGFNVDVELPRDKLELIDVQVNGEFFVAEHDKKLKSVPLKASKKQKSTPSDKNELCFNQLEIVGLNVCVVSSTSLSDIGAGPGNSQGLANVEDFHLSRPFSFAIYTTVERKFNFKGTHSTLPSGSQQWKLEYSTPGSKVSHDTSIAFELGTKPKTYGRLSLDNPQYHLGLEAGISNDNHELVIYGQYEQDKDVKRSKIGFAKNGNEYKPLIEIHDKNGITNNINGYRADGKIVVLKSNDKQARYNFQNFQIISPNNERIVLNGWADVGPSSLNTELRIAPGQQAYLLKSNFKLDNGQYAAGVFVNDESSPENVYGSSAQLTIGQNLYSLQLTGKALTWSVKSTSEFEFVKGDNSNTLTSSKFSHDLTVDHKNKPVGSLNVKSSFGVNKFHLDAEAVRDQKSASLNIKYQSNQRSVRDYELLAKGRLNKHFIDVTSKCDASGNILIVDNSISTSCGILITAKGELGQRYTAQDIHIDLQGSAQFSNKEKPIQWLLKVLGTPEKTNSEFRASRDNAELIKLTTESQHPLDKISAAKINLILKNQLNAKGDFKIAKNGKGELTATIETQKTEPKHKIEIDSKFHVQAPKYDVDASVTIDGDKKFHFKTENVAEKLKFSTKNVLEADAKKLSFEANGALKGEWRTNGDIQGGFTLITPDGHTFDGSVNRHVTTNPKTHISQGTVELQVNEQEPGNGKKRSVSFKGKLDKMNTKTKELSTNAQLVYTNFNGQKAELGYHIKHLLKGQNKALDLGFSVQGIVFDQVPLELSVVIDEYSPQHAIGRISIQFGERVTAKFNGNYHVGQINVPATYELQGNLQVPESKFKNWELSSQGKLLKPVDGANGAHNLEFVLNSKTGDGQFTRINTVWKGTAQQGTYTFDAQNNNLAAPLKFEGSYQSEQDALSSDASGNWKYSFNAQYGDKYVKSNMDINLVESTKTSAINWKLDTSYESVKNFELIVRTHKAAEDSFVISTEFQNAGKSFGTESKIFSSTHKKGVDLRANLSSGQPIVLLAIIEILGERKAKLTVDIQQLVDVDLKLNAEASYSSIDDFYIRGDLNSKKLKLDSYVLDIKAQNKSVKVHVKNAQGVVLSGTASYTLKKDQNKAIIEGQGQVQTQGKTITSNFKLTRQYFTLSTEKEVGFSYTFNGNVGPKNAVLTLKLTNKEFNLKQSICEEKRQCVNLQLQSTVSVDEKQLNNAEHGVLILVDLREIGYPYELEWKSKSLRQGLKFEYNVVGHISGNNHKYQLNANILPTGSTVELTLPKRQIHFETIQKLPTGGTIFGHYEQSAAFYIDKLHRPNDVARVSAVLDVSGIEQVAFNSKGQLKVEHPTIRSLTVSGSIDANRDKHIVNSEFIFDVFRTADQKVIASSQIRNTQSKGGFNITSNQKIHSSGLQFEYELNMHSALNTDTKEFSAGTELQSDTLDLNAGALIFGNKDRVEISVNGFNEQIVFVRADLDWQKHSSKINSKIQAFGQKPVEILTELQPNWAKISINRQNLINANAEIKLGKEFKFDILSNGKSISNGRVALDAANFLQTNYKINDEEVKAFQDSLDTEVKKETEVIMDKLKKRFDKVRDDLEEKLKLVKQSTPDIEKLRNGYENQLKSIVNELETDPALAPIIDNIRHLIEKINKFIEEVSKTLAENYEKLHKAFGELFEKLQELWKNSILKAWEQLVVSMTKLIGQLRVEIVNVYSTVFKSLIAWLEKYGPALKNYAKAIDESLKPVHEAAQELIKVIVNITEETIDEIKEYLAKLPTFEKIRDELTEKIKQLKLIENVLEVLNHIFAQLHILPQTPETNELLKKLHEYLEAKLKQQPINDEKWLEELSKLLIKAVQSFWAAIESNAPVVGVPAADVYGWTSTLPHFVDELAKLPTLLSFRSSVINFILNENWENIFSKDLYSSWLYSILFQNFELHGQLVNGQHVFSFDGQTYAYPGNCKYILAQDSVDNNFTIIAHLTENKLKAITLVDRDGNFMEISDTVALKVNNKPVEYPQHLPGIHAWRKFHTVYVHSEYGVTVTCTIDLKVCHVMVNGFYTSKTRGLLGNGNAEPYDDYLLIDGTLATDSAALGNDYGIGKCNPIAFNKAQLESPTRNEICSEIFGIESTLALNYLTLDYRPYRKACDFAVKDVAEKDKESVACTFALAYGFALKELDKWVLLPPRCLKCAGPVGQREVGEEFIVKTPTNKADVVFVVDINVTPKVLSNLVAPAITDIRDALKTRGFTDVQVGVIAFDESKRYPALLTSDNGKINYKGNVANVQLNGPKNFCDNCVEQIITEKRVLEIYKLLERFVKTIVPQSDENAFKLALDFPFRAGAAKSIIGVRSDSLEYSNWWKLVRAHITGSMTQFDGALLHLIAPIKGLALEGVPAEKLVGFNARLVATLDGKDNKKRAKLQFENDMGIDFVLNNGGWAFATQNFDKLKAPDQKKVLTQVTSSIADTLFKTETVSDCRCLPVSGLYGQHKCAIKSTSFVPNKKAKAT